MERLFTETEWRAVSLVESASFSISSATLVLASKPLIGASFSGGEFRLAWVDRYLRDGIAGPRLVEWVVYEARSLLCFCSRRSGAAEAIGEARSNIEDIGPNHLAWLIDEAVADREWREERARAAAQERAEKKAKTIKKRARLVFEASGGKCHYCGCTLDLLGKWHIEHKMPRALKGGSEMHNLVASCVPCNMRKRDKTDLEFQALLEAERAVQAAQSSVCDVNPRGSVGVVHAADSLARH